MPFQDVSGSLCVEEPSGALTPRVASCRAPASAGPCQDPSELWVPWGSKACSRTSAVLQERLHAVLQRFGSTVLAPG